MQQIKSTAALMQIDNHSMSSSIQMVNCVKLRFNFSRYTIRIGCC